MSKSSETFINFLKGALLGHGAVSEFCRKSGFARPTVDRWLKGENSPTLENLERIAAILDKPVPEMLSPSYAFGKSDPILRELFSRLLAMEQDQLEALLTHVRIQSKVLDELRSTHEASTVKKKRG